MCDLLNQSISDTRVFLAGLAGHRATFQLGLAFQVEKRKYPTPVHSRSFPGGSDGKESACTDGDQSSIPGLGRSPREGNGYPLQYSCLENLMDRGAWQAAVHEVTGSWT